MDLVKWQSQYQTLGLLISPLPCVLFMSLRAKASLSFGSQSAKEKQKLDIDRSQGSEVAVGYWLSDIN